MDRIEASVFFEAAPPPLPKPPAVRENSLGRRMAVWVPLGVFILLSAYMTLRFLEADSRLRQSGVFFESRQRQLAKLERKWAEMKKEEGALKDQLQGGEEKRKSLEGTVEFLQKRMSRRAGRAAHLVEWARLRPAGVWFTEWSHKGKEIRVRGQSPERRLIANFLRGLGRSPRLAGPQVTLHGIVSKPSGDLYDFEITAHEAP